MSDLGTNQHKIYAKFSSESSELVFEACGSVAFVDASFRKFMETAFPEPKPSIVETFIDFVLKK